MAWIVEKYKEWTDEEKQLPEDAIDINQLLTNVSLYWFNKTGASSAEMLYENMSMAFNWGGPAIENSSNQWTPPKVPTALPVFGKKENESLLKKLQSLMGEPDRYSFFETGGHFPALEIPDVLVNDLRQFFSDIVNAETRSLKG